VLFKDVIVPKCASYMNAGLFKSKVLVQLQKPSSQPTNPGSTPTLN
jgi:hypothetical protein